MSACIRAGLPSILARIGLRISTDANETAARAGRTAASNDTPTTRPAQRRDILLIFRFTGEKSSHSEWTPDLEHNVAALERVELDCDQQPVAGRTIRECLIHEADRDTVASHVEGVFDLVQLLG